MLLPPLPQTPFDDLPDWLKMLAEALHGAGMEVADVSFQASDDWRMARCEEAVCKLVKMYGVDRMRAMRWVAGKCESERFRAVRDERSAWEMLLNFIDGHKYDADFKR